MKAPKNGLQWQAPQRNPKMISTTATKIPPFLKWKWINVGYHNGSKLKLKTFVVLTTGTHYFWYT